MVEFVQKLGAAGGLLVFDLEDTILDIADII
jgi:hypothetical protein